MKIIDMMHRPPVTIRPDQTITDAAIEMERAGVGVLAVIDGTGLVGIVTDRDLVRRGLATRTAPDARVDSIMTQFGRGGPMIEECPELLAATTDKTLITDDNMGTEWRYYLNLEPR